MTNDDPRTLTGVIAIPVTTFTDEGELDLDGLRSQVDFCVSAGSNGLLYPGVVSEFYTLTDDERRRAVEACGAAVDGRVPFVVGVSAASTAASVELARHARSLDADAVMTMIPFVQHFFAPSPEFARGHVEAVAASCDCPVILQNARIGFPIGIGALAGLVDAVPQVEYVKEENTPPTQGISGVVTALGDRVRGVFGGVGGVYLVNELDRGAIGTMPSPAFVDRIVDAYEVYRAGDPDAAQDRLESMGSLFTRELLYNVVLIKEVLRRRGVIRSVAVRVASPALDDVDLRDLDRLMRRAKVH
jgi:dihydrodipicolinate synthase/N-acetylneuraminate lyase